MSFINVNYAHTNRKDNYTKVHSKWKG